MMGWRGNTERYQMRFLIYCNAGSYGSEEYLDIVDGVNTIRVGILHNM